MALHHDHLPSKPLFQFLVLELTGGSDHVQAHTACHGNNPDQFGWDWLAGSNIYLFLISLFRT